MDKSESSAALLGGVSTIGEWTEEELTLSGKWIRNRLKSRREYDYSDVIPEDGKSLPGIIEAESFVAKSEGLQVESTSDAGGGESFGYTSDSSGTYILKLQKRDGNCITLPVTGLN
ncbi:MAG: hypothetical protein ACOCSE_04635 [Chitinivibrionales bacterium]